MAIADRCTVLWHGKSVGTVELRDPKITKEYLSELMVGRKVTLVPDKPEQKLGQEILTVKELSVIDKRTKKSVVNKVSFSVQSGRDCLYCQNRRKWTNRIGRGTGGTDQQ